MGALGIYAEPFPMSGLIMMRLREKKIMEVFEKYVEKLR